MIAGEREALSNFVNIVLSSQWVFIKPFYHEGEKQNKMGI